MNLNGHDIGVCSWSLRPKDMDELVSQLDALRLDHLQLALGSLLKLDEATRQREIEKLNSAEVAITAGMISFAGENYSTIASIRRTGGIVPSELWEARRAHAVACADLAQSIGIDQASLHMGFLPPGSDAAYRSLVERANELAGLFRERGLGILLETGQERASDLLTFLNDLNLDNVGVNFDPANMILYGSGDPIEAVQRLGRHIHHVHIKDAMASDAPGVEWGHETPFGQGDLDATNFLRALSDAGYDGPLIIECEGGADRIASVRAGIEKLTELLS